MNVKLGIEADLKKLCESLGDHIHDPKLRYDIIWLVFIRYMGLRYPVSPAATWWGDITSMYDIGTFHEAVTNISNLYAPLADDKRPQFFVDRTHGKLFMEVVKHVEAWNLPIADEVDTLGRIYEYFLEWVTVGTNDGGEYYTPPSVVKLVNAMMVQPFPAEPYTAYDPCCGSGGMFLGLDSAASAYGQEINEQTYLIAIMNLIARERYSEAEQICFGDTMVSDAWSQERFDRILTNPPFNHERWDGGGSILPGFDDRFTRYGPPPADNGNYAWLQHVLHHLKPKGRAAVVMTRISLSAARDAQASIREAMVRDGVVHAVVALPGHLFYNTKVKTCIWILGRERRDDGKVLFINADTCGTREGDTRVLTDDDIARIATVYQEWDYGGIHVYEEEPGFHRAVSIEEIEKRDFVMLPGWYVPRQLTPYTGIDIAEAREEFQRAFRELCVDMEAVQQSWIKGLAA